MTVFVRDVERDRGCWVVYWQWGPHEIRSAGRARTFNDWEASLCREARRLQVPVELTISHSQFGSRIKDVSLSEVKHADS